MLSHALTVSDDKQTLRLSDRRSCSRRVRVLLCAWRLPHLQRDAE
jgi:hypothetical protein